MLVKTRIAGSNLRGKRLTRRRSGAAPCSVLVVTWKTGISLLLLSLERLEASLAFDGLKITGIKLQRPLNRRQSFGFAAQDAQYPGFTVPGRGRGSVE